MAKGYWVSVYRTIHDPEKLAAVPALVGALRSPGYRKGGPYTHFQNNA